MTVRKLPATAISSTDIGFFSLYDSWGFGTSPDFALRGGGDVVQVQALRSSSAYGAANQQAKSDVLSLSVWNVDGETVPVAGGNVTVTFTLTNTANSPSCSTWDGNSWYHHPQAMQTASRTAGAVVTCTTGNPGSFAIIDICDPGTTCSGNGACMFDGTCSCNLGWTGPSCASQYCDSVLFPCINGGECVCAAEPMDCFADCMAESDCATQCNTKCPPGSLLNYTVSNCPVEQQTRQTACQCPCGFSGPRCETAGPCVSSSR